MKLKPRPSERQERFSRFVMLSGEQALSGNLTHNKLRDKCVCKNLEKGPAETMSCLQSKLLKTFAIISLCSELKMRKTYS